EQARGSVVAAQYNLDNATLIAPFDGIVNQIGLNPGELSNTGSSAGSGAITIVEPSELRVDVNVGESDIGGVELGQQGQLSIDAWPGRTIRGRVAAVAPQSTTQQGVTSYAVSISLDPGQSGVRPGMSATANIIYASKADALLVPNRALRRQGRDQVVDVLTADGTVAARVVRRGISNDQTSEITDGLAEGDQVVIPTTQTRAPANAQFGGPGGPGGFGGGIPGGGP